MFGIGLSLTIRDFRQVLITPRSLVIGLTGQMVILPVIAFLLASWMGLPPEIKVGFVIIAACPGGATSNLITYLLRGNVALSISLTTINSFITLITVPLIIYLGLFIFMGEGETIRLPIWKTIVNIFIITIIPVTSGILLKYFKPALAKRIEKPGRFVLPILFFIIYLTAVFLGSEKGGEQGISALYFKVIPWALALNILGMTTGLMSAKWFGYAKETQITLSVEIGIQNSALAITIASSALFLDNPAMAIPAIVYGLFTFVSAVIFGFLIKRSVKIQW
jgi:BASS family bile acid:Na+ symporter